MEMTSQTWARIGEILDRAFEARPADRAALIDRLCAGDVELRAEVEAFAHAYERDGATFDRPLTIQAGAGIEVRPDAVGLEVGGYRLASQIGAGGMGVVYEAHRADATYEKRAAVKLLRGGPGDEISRRRFLREIRILAALEHPNVARLIDGGVAPTGEPYLVMERVEGVSVDRYCREQGLSVRQRVILFLAVCDAVQYAHRNLVVHRDLKPGNVLVSADGVPKLLDFGVARLLAEDEDATITGAGERLLTPAYASPEQLRGEPATTASDVFALGALLYYLLAGRGPFPDDVSPLALARRVEAEPLPPSQVADEAAWGEDADQARRAISDDLDRIVGKAMRSEPERRYATVDRLAEDLRRWLDGLPVSARPDSLGYRARKLAARHRGAVTAGALAVLALVGGIVATSWQARAAAGARDRAEEEAARAELEAERAESVNAFVLDMLSAPDPRVEGRDVRVADVLDRAAARVDRSLADQPAVAAEIHRTLGRTYLGLGLLEEAVRETRTAVEQARSATGDARRDVALALTDFGVALSEAGQFEESEARLREALGGFDALDLEIERAIAMNHLAVTLKRTGRAEEAERLYRAAIEILEAHPGANDHQYGEALNNLGVLLGDRGEPLEAERLHRRAIAIMRELYGDEHPDVAYMEYNIGGSLDLQKRYAEAEPFYRSALFKWERLLGEEHPLTIMAGAGLSQLLWVRGEAGEALEVGSRTVERAHRGLPPDHPLTAYARIVHGQALIELGRAREAEAELREALRIRVGSLGPDHWLTANARASLGRALAEQRRYAEAEREILRAYRLLLDERGSSHEKTVQARDWLVELYRAWGRPAEAAEYASD